MRAEFFKKRVDSINLEVHCDVKSPLGDHRSIPFWPKFFSLYSVTKNIWSVPLSNYNFISTGEDVDYNGDDDQFDTLERQRRTIALPDELSSVIHEGI